MLNQLMTPEQIIALASIGESETLEFKATTGTRRGICPVSDLTISEAGSVQFPMVENAAAVGWTPLASKAAEHKRGGTGQVQSMDKRRRGLL